MFRTIIFANEGSPAADRALLYVEHLARLEEAEVVVVHAFQVPSRYGTTDVYDELHATFEKASWAVVDDALEELQKVGLSPAGLCGRRRQRRPSWKSPTKWAPR